MSWIVIAAVATASSVSILMLVNVYLYRRYRERFIKLWAVAWGIHVLRYLSMIISALWQPSSLTSAFYYVCVIISAVVLLNGTRIFIGKPPAKWSKIAGGLIALWSIVSLSLHLPSISAIIPVFAFLSYTYIHIGYQLLQQTKQGETAGRITGIVFIVWGIHQADYPFLRPIEWFAPWGFLLGSILATAAAIGMILIYFERIQRALEEKEDSLKKQNNQLLATEEKLGIQIEEYSTAMKLLKESEERFHELHNATFGGIIIHDKGLILDCNKGLSDMTGFTFEELIGMDGLTLIAPETLGTVVTNIEQGYDKRYEVVGVRKDGSKYPLSIRGKNTTYRGREVRVIEFQDVSEQKKVEACQKEIEEKYRRVVETANEGIVILNSETELTFVNQQMASLLGYSIGEMLGQKMERFLAEDQLADHREQMALRYQGKDAIYERCFRKKCGGRLWTLVSARVIFNREGRLDGSFGMIADITKLKQAEHNVSLALAEAQHFRDAIDCFPAYVYMKDPQCRYVYGNRPTLELFGCTAQELVGTSDSHYFPEETARQLREVDARVVAGHCSMEEIVIPHADGSQRVYWEVKTPLYANDGSGVIWGMCGISTDITEHKRTEAELLKMEKLESLGVLAGGIAHDFNNILTGIMGNISYAQMFLPEDHKSYKPLNEAEKATVRASELSHQLLTFARGGEPVKKVISVQQLLRDATSLLLRGSNVKVFFKCPDTLHSIEADEGQMSQVINNIIINAVQAMPGGGVLTIEAQNVQVEADNALVLLPGSYICLVFSDQGEGISDTVVKKIFDPFFTTKPAGNGLGLASARSIVHKHGGHIGVSSIIGVGTAFTIHLPSRGEATLPRIMDSAPTAEIHSGGTILVMDDEEAIRSMTSEILMFFGYRVETCGNGREAVELYRQAYAAGTCFSAVIMDLTIPGGMGGKEAAQQILRIDPEARLIVSSGYSNDPIMSDYGAYGFTGAVAKPYNMRDFGEYIGMIIKLPAAEATACIQNKLS